MINSISLYNTVNQASVILNRSNSDYLIDDDGLDWGRVDTRISSVSNIDSVGVDIDRVFIDTPRDITISGWVVGTESQMANKKSFLSKVISPKSLITITVGEYKIDVYATSALHISSEYRENNEVMCRFNVTMTAPYPFFYVTKTYSSGFDHVLNLGDIPVGVRISGTINAGGIVAVGKTYFQQFSLENYDGSTASLILDTTFGKKTLTIDGHPGFKYMNLGTSKWLQVPVSYNDTDYISFVTSNITLSRVSFDEAHASLGDM